MIPIMPIKVLPEKRSHRGANHHVFYENIGHFHVCHFNIENIGNMIDTQCDAGRWLMDGDLRDWYETKTKEQRYRRIIERRISEADEIQSDHAYETGEGSSVSVPGTE